MGQAVKLDACGLWLPAGPAACTCPGALRRPELKVLLLFRSQVLIDFVDRKIAAESKTEPKKPTLLW